MKLTWQGILTHTGMIIIAKKYIRVSDSYRIVAKNKHMKKPVFSLMLIFILATLMKSFAQEPGLYIPLNIQKAYENKTRSLDGKPGQNYWQNSADYIINLDFNPETRLLKGNEKIKYFNNSPDTLKEIIIHLYPDFFKKGNARDKNIDFSDESDGVIIEKIAINNKETDISPQSKKMKIYHTWLKLKLDSPILPKSSLMLDISWKYTLNLGSHIRTGTVDSSSFFIAYFFPHVAVYDDIHGWNKYNYTGTTEFYNDFSNYEVSINIPENFIVWATGLLQNPEEVLSEKVLQRYKLAMTSDSIIHIIDSTEVMQNNTILNGLNTWKFKAMNVPDFAFATSDHYLWDATSLVVDENTGRRVLVDAAYNKNSKDFYKVADIASQSIKYMSQKFPGVPFPYPQMTVFNGGTGMEFPMILNNMSVYHPNMGHYPNKQHLLLVFTAHEIAHTYFPFYMGTNEIKYAWMDEGWATLTEFLIGSELDTINTTKILSIDKYKKVIGTETDFPIISLSDIIKNPAYRINSLPKAAIFNFILKDLLGDDLFKKSLHEYMDRWNGKHPMPYDFFFTFNEACGMNLNWLYKPWFFEYGYPDLALRKVSKDKSKYSIVVEKIGNYPVPIYLKITYSDGSINMAHEKVSVWKDGNNEYIIDLNSEKPVRQIELSNPVIPDADLTNNVIYY